MTVITNVEALVLDGRVEYGKRLDDGEMAGPRYASLIKVSTDAGITGYADVDSHPWIVQALVNAPTQIPEFCAGLRDAVVGQSVWNRTALWERMYRHSWYHGRRGPALHAMSGIDLAVWDIAGRLAGRPIHDLLGGARRDRVLAYASTLFRETPEEMRKAARSYLDRGFRAIKFGWGAWGADPARDRSLLAAVRDEVGPDVHLMVDGHLPGDLSAVRRILDGLAEFGLQWVEEPLPADRPGDLAALGRTTNVRVATGEQLGGVGEFEELLATEGVSVVQPDLSRCGGFTAIQTIAPLALARGALVVPHAWTSQLLTAASLHVNAWLPGPVFQEYNASSAPLASTLATGLELVDGHVLLPPGPGLGITVDENVVEAHRIL
ncbi:mandelate racemase/muconate lactonizing enzyme family protein [Kribbella sp. NBC_01245]|uniref:mandelate racemase/muconate lactonizing enzyme family protein n=1 Tax=Kribbella sp. NBC_01245 TaxID=2903578 RepID=UPI002E2B9C02|nr:mandelate racemase/muconate lactonizing enzyme family protein [Kribbella sp. NBC_01245]